MTESGFPRRLRTRRVALAAAGTGAAVFAAAVVAIPGDTVASFVGDVWAGAEFSTGSFGIESSLTNLPESYENHSSSPLDLTVDTPISLAPGEVAYSGFYIKRTENTEENAVVTVSGPTGAPEPPGILWNEYLTFVAKVAPVATTGTTCGPRMIENPAWRPIYTSGTFASPAPQPGATFIIGEPGPGFSAGEPYMVCFQFTLDADVVNEAPKANGESVRPIWTLTAEPQS